MSSIIEIDIKNRIYYFFDDMMSIKYLDPNNIKIEILTEILIEKYSFLL